MSHNRIQIKTAAAAVASQALQSAGIEATPEGAADRVYIQRALPTDHTDYPAILIYAHPENVEEFNSAYLRHELDLHFEVIVCGDEAVVDLLLDTITAALEDEIKNNESLTGTVTRCVPESTDFEYVQQARQLVGAARLTTKAHYFVSRETDADRDPLERITASRGDGTADSIDLPQE